MAREEYNHTLYTFKWSICAIMVRYTFACRGEPKNPDSEIRIQESEVDLYTNKQLSEHYLCDINPNGEVPVLVPNGGQPMPESVDISFYLAKSYPALIPAPHEAEIKRLIKELHTISFFSLTFTGRPELVGFDKKFLEDQLRGDISDRYRAAAERKLKRLGNKLEHLNNDDVEKNITRAKILMAEFETLLSQSSTQWCFDLEQPSALDAHLVVFIARMFDKNRQNLIPQLLQEYANRAFKTAEWKSVMQGRSTDPVPKE